MFSIQSNHPTLAQKTLGGQPSIITGFTLMIVGSIALWVSAKISIPFYPVPLTMQTFVVLVIGMAFGWRLGAATILLYLTEGALGLPVFANTPERGIGLAYMIGPTGGYLLGFILATVTVGWLAERGWDRRISTSLAALTIGTTIIFLTGILWLGILLGWEKPIVALGVTPFILGAILKILLAATTLPLIWKFIQKK